MATRTRLFAAPECKEERRVAIDDGGKRECVSKPRQPLNIHQESRVNPTNPDKSGWSASSKGRTAATVEGQVHSRDHHHLDPTRRMGITSCLATTAASTWPRRAHGSTPHSRTFSTRNSADMRKVHCCISAAASNGTPNPKEAESAIGSESAAATDSTRPTIRGDWTILLLRNRRTARPTR